MLIVILFFLLVCMVGMASDVHKLANPNGRPSRPSKPSAIKKYWAAIKSRHVPLEGWWSKNGLSFSIFVVAVLGYCAIMYCYA